MHQDEALNLSHDVMEKICKEMKHGDIILNRSNNSVFLLRKSIEIGKSLISSAPQEFE